MLKGQKVYLSAIEKQDLPHLMNWRNIPEFRKHYREYRELNSDMQNSWYQNKVLSDNTTVMFAIHDNEDGRLIGCCGICYVNWVNRNGDISLYIGENEIYLDDRARDAWVLLMDYAFNILGLHKLWAEIYQLDHKRKSLVEGLGFNLDGVQRQHYFYKGKWWDSSMYSILEDEYRKFFEQPEEV